jgi:hypothetical protein
MLFTAAEPGWTEALRNVVTVAEELWRWAAVQGTFVHALAVNMNPESA